MYRKAGSLLADRRSAPITITSCGLRELATVAQPCGYPVDGQMDCLHHALVGIAGPVTLRQFDLHMVERIEVGKAVLNRARQQGILIEQCLLAAPICRPRLKFRHPWSQSQTQSIQLPPRSSSIFAKSKMPSLSNND
jgi:hypothetical protein